MLQLYDELSDALLAFEATGVALSTITIRLIVEVSRGYGGLVSKDSRNLQLSDDPAQNRLKMVGEGWVFSHRLYK